MNGDQINKILKEREREKTSLVFIFKDVGSIVNCMLNVRMWNTF